MFEETGDPSVHCGHGHSTSGASSGVSTCAFSDSQPQKSQQFPANQPIGGSQEGSDICSLNVRQNLSSFNQSVDTSSMVSVSSPTSNSCNLLVDIPTAAYDSFRAASPDPEASSYAEPPFTKASSGTSSPLLTKPSWLVKVRGALTPREWITVGCLAAAICALHVIGWGTLIVFVVPGHYALAGGGGTFGVGLGVTAYMLGMRHAFDADHIAAIDNTTRKFLAEGRRTLTVGFWFALGHSSVVFLAALIIAVGFKAFAGEVESEESQLHVILGLVGALVSSLFLLLIGAINLLVLIHLVKVFRAMRKGTARETDLEDLTLQGGLFTRCLGRVAALIKHPPQMYLLGFLFGLGFDTATEVALLFMAAGAASSGLPWFAILCLPVIFAAGMTLLDTIDGSFMNFAYSWAFSFPLRKLFFNIVITGLSVMVALLIGGIELLQLVIEKAGWEGQPWDSIAGMDLNILGFVIVGLFFLTWMIALAIWHSMQYETSADIS